MKCGNKALSSVQATFILLIGVWRKYHHLMQQNNKTRGREVRETYLGGIDSTVQDEKLTVVTGLACFRRSDVHSVGM